MTAYSIKADGTLSNKQKYGWLHVPDTDENAWPDGLKSDTAGRLYVATRIGIQVLDQLGRVNAILPAPPSNSQTSNVYFGGPALDVLYVTAGDKVFRRKLKTKGVHSFEKPLETRKSPYVMMLRFILLFSIVAVCFSTAPSSVAGKKICVDPGHGGTAATDSYRVGVAGEREEWINLRVALALKKMLGGEGCGSYYDEDCRRSR